MRVIPGYLLVLDKVFILTALSGCLAWIAEYTASQGWRNSMGRTLLTKTSLLAGLLGLSAANAFFNLNRGDSLVLAWIAVVLLALIGPVMIWRMVVFHRVSRAVRHCPDGHQVSLLARYCPRCGKPVPGAPPPAD